MVCCLLGGFLVGFFFFLWVVLCACGFFCLFVLFVC